MGKILENKVAIVTGGASGMGKAGVELFSKYGCISVIADINDQEAIKIMDEINYKGDKVDFFHTDVTNSKNVQSTIKSVVDKYGKVDILFHNAVDVPLVNNHDKRITELPEEIWHKITTLVLDGTFYCSKYVASQMLIQKSGSIILTATTDALIGQAGLDAYTAAKGGIIALTRSMAAGLSPEGVRVNAICPGTIKGDRMKRVIRDKAKFLKTSQKIIEKEFVSMASMNSWIYEEDIAKMCSFLISKDSERVSGQIIGIDGNALRLD